MPPISVPVMPQFSLIDFIDQSIIVWTDYPSLSVAFCAVAILVAFRCVFLARIRVTQVRHERDDREREPLRRVVLDATARFPPRVEDRKRVG